MTIDTNIFPVNIPLISQLSYPKSSLQIEISEEPLRYKPLDIPGFAQGFRLIAKLVEKKIVNFNGILLVPIPSIPLEERAVSALVDLLTKPMQIVGCDNQFSISEALVETHKKIQNFLKIEYGIHDLKTEICGSYVLWLELYDPEYVERLFGNVIENPKEFFSPHIKHLNLPSDLDLRVTCSDAKALIRTRLKNYIFTSFANLLAPSLSPEERFNLVRKFGFVNMKNIGQDDKSIDKFLMFAYGNKVDWMIIEKLTCLYISQVENQTIPIDELLDAVRNKTPLPTIIPFSPDDNGVAQALLDGVTNITHIPYPNLQNVHAFPKIICKITKGTFVPNHHEEQKLFLNFLKITNYFILSKNNISGWVSDVYSLFKKSLYGHLKNHEYSQFFYTLNVLARFYDSEVSPKAICLLEELFLDELPEPVENHPFKYIIIAVKNRSLPMKQLFNLLEINGFIYQNLSHEGSENSVLEYLFGLHDGTIALQLKVTINNYSNYIMRIFFPDKALEELKKWIYANKSSEKTLSPIVKYLCPIAPILGNSITPMSLIYSQLNVNLKQIAQIGIHFFIGQNASVRYMGQLLIVCCNLLQPDTNSVRSLIENIPNYLLAFDQNEFELYIERIQTIIQNSTELVKSFAAVLAIIPLLRSQSLNIEQKFLKWFSAYNESLEMKTKHLLLKNLNYWIAQINPLKIVEFIHSIIQILIFKMPKLLIQDIYPQLITFIKNCILLKKHNEISVDYMDEILKKVLTEEQIEEFYKYSMLSSATSKPEISKEVIKKLQLWVETSSYNNILRQIADYELSHFEIKNLMHFFNVLTQKLEQHSSEGTFLNRFLANPLIMEYYCKYPNKLFSILDSHLKWSVNNHYSRNRFIIIELLERTLKFIFENKNFYLEVPFSLISHCHNLIQQLHTLPTSVENLLRKYSENFFAVLKRFDAYKEILQLSGILANVKKCQSFSDNQTYVTLWAAQQLINIPSNNFEDIYSVNSLLLLALGHEKIKISQFSVLQIEVYCKLIEKLNLLDQEYLKQKWILKISNIISNNLELWNILKKYSPLNKKNIQFLLQIWIAIPQGKSTFDQITIFSDCIKFIWESKQTILLDVDFPSWIIALQKLINLKIELNKSHKKVTFPKIYQNNLFWILEYFISTKSMMNFSQLIISVTEHDVIVKNSLLAKKLWWYFCSCTYTENPIQAAEMWLHAHKQKIWDYNSTDINATTLILEIIDKLMNPRQKSSEKIIQQILKIIINTPEIKLHSEKIKTYEIKVIEELLTEKNLIEALKKFSILEVFLSETECNYWNFKFFEHYLDHNCINEALQYYYKLQPQLLNEKILQSIKHICEEFHEIVRTQNFDWSIITNIFHPKFLIFESLKTFNIKLEILQYHLTLKKSDFASIIAIYLQWLENEVGFKSHLTDFFSLIIATISENQSQILPSKTISLLMTTSLEIMNTLKKIQDPQKVYQIFYYLNLNKSFKVFNMQHSEMLYWMISEISTKPLNKIFLEENYEEISKLLFSIKFLDVLPQVRLLALILFASSNSVAQFKPTIYLEECSELLKKISSFDEISILWLICNWIDSLLKKSPLPQEVYNIVSDIILHIQNYPFLGQQIESLVTQMIFLTEEICPEKCGRIILKAFPIVQHNKRILIIRENLINKFLQNDNIESLMLAINLASELPHIAIKSWQLLFQKIITLNNKGLIEKILDVLSALIPKGIFKEFPTFQKSFWRICLNNLIDTGSSKVVPYIKDIRQLICYFEPPNEDFTAEIYKIIILGGCKLASNSKFLEQNNYSKEDLINDVIILHNELKDFLIMHPELNFDLNIISFPLINIFFQSNKTQQFISACEKIYILMKQYEKEKIKNELLFVINEMFLNLPKVDFELIEVTTLKYIEFIINEMFEYIDLLKYVQILCSSPNIDFVVLGASTLLEIFKKIEQTNNPFFIQKKQIINLIKDVRIVQSLNKVKNTFLTSYSIELAQLFELLLSDSKIKSMLVGQDITFLGQDIALIRMKQFNIQYESNDSYYCDYDLVSFACSSFADVIPYPKIYNEFLEKSLKNIIKELHNDKDTYSPLLERIVFSALESQYRSEDRAYIKNLLSLILVQNSSTLKESEIFDISKLSKLILTPKREDKFLEFFIVLINALIEKNTFKMNAQVFVQLPYMYIQALIQMYSTHMYHTSRIIKSKEDKKRFVNECENPFKEKIFKLLHKYTFCPEFNNQKMFNLHQENCKKIIAYLEGMPNLDENSRLLFLETKIFVAQDFVSLDTLKLPQKKQSIFLLELLIQVAIHKSPWRLQRAINIFTQIVILGIFNPKEYIQIFKMFLDAILVLPIQFHENIDYLLKSIQNAITLNNPLLKKEKTWLDVIVEISAYYSISVQNYTENLKTNTNNFYHDPEKSIQTYYHALILHPVELLIQIFKMGKFVNDILLKLEIIFTENCFFQMTLFFEYLEENDDTREPFKILYANLDEMFHHIQWDSKKIMGFYSLMIKGLITKFPDKLIIIIYAIEYLINKNHYVQDIVQFIKIIEKIIQVAINQISTLNNGKEIEKAFAESILGALVNKNVVLCTQVTLNWTVALLNSNNSACIEIANHIIPLKMEK